MRRLKDYLVPLQKGDSRLTPSRPVRTSVLGSVSPPTSFPALDTGRLLATRPCIKSKSKKVVAPWHLADLQSVFCPRWFGSCAILPLSKKRTYGRRCIQRVTKER